MEKDQEIGNIPEASPKETYFESLVRQNEETRKRIIETLKQSGNRSAHYISPKVERKIISEKIEDTEEKRKKELENDALAQNIELKGKTLDRLFMFLSAETVVVFLLSFLQGFNIWNFYLEEWSFRLIVAVTITQITIMLQVAVKHLFPHK